MGKLSSFCFILLVCLLPLSLFGQGRGKTFVQNYPPKVYQGHAQNWALIQDPRGILYIGNGNGVMEYDGNNWSITPLPNQVTARSMALSNENILYVGTSNGFGYMSTDAYGAAKYIPLDTLLPDSLQQKISNIWATHCIGSAVYFRSYYNLYRYQDGKIQYWKRKGKRIFYSSFILNNEYHIYEAGRKARTVSKVGRENLIQVADNERFIGRSTGIVIPYKSDTVILGNRNGNFYKYPFSKNHEWDSTVLFKSLHQTLARSPVYTNAVKFDGGYALGSSRNGLLLFDKNFQFVQQIDQESNDLINNSVLTLMIDRDGAAWVGGANGLARIDLASEVVYWNQKTGLEGTLSWIARFKENLYVATSNSTFVFSSAQGSEIKQVTRIQNTQCWHLLPYTNPDNPSDERLLLTTRLVWELDGTKVKPVLNYKDGGATTFKMYQDQFNPYRVWLAFGNGFGSMRLETAQTNPDELSGNQTRWVEETRIEGAEDNCRSMVQDSNGDIWIGTFRNGVIRLKKQAGERAFEVIRYKTEEGVLSNKNVLVYQAMDKIIFATDKGLCTYDKNTDRFVPFTAFGKAYADGSKDVFSLQEDSKGNVWLCGLFNGQSAGVVAEKQADNSYQINPNPFKKVPPMMALAMMIEDDGTAWLGGSEGLFRYKPNPNISKKDANYTTLIRKVIAGKDSILFAGNYAQEVNALSVLSFDTTQQQTPLLEAGQQLNNVNFYFAAPFFDNESETQYAFFLQGFDQDWQPWSDKRQKEYTNLAGGEYVFRVKAKNLYGNESEVATYRFSINPPWYLRWWAYVLYVTAGLVVLFFAVKWNARRLEKENLRLEGVITERTAEVRKQADELLIKNSELSQQKEEILVQAENLRDLNNEITSINDDLNTKKEALERANTNIQNLSVVGKTITSTLDLREVIRIVYENVNNLMDASGFGIGVYQKRENILTFKGYMEKGEVLPDHFEEITKEASSIAIEVFNTGKAYFSNDLEADLAKQGRKLDILQGEVPLSLIYLPLVYGQQKVGVITVQSFEKNAYTQHEFEILETLASYASIALANAQGYEIIRYKNKSITDSIRYSQAIQKAFLPSPKELKAAFKDYCLFYKPRDIVSGDFYWVKNIPEQNKVFVAVVDCTGHGVPGSFMSIIGATLLNEIVNLQHIHEPAQILEQLNQGVIAALSQENQQEVLDGMDVCLCLLEYNESKTAAKVTFSGAKRNLYYFENQSTKLQMLKGDRKLIGGWQNLRTHFTNQEITLEQGAKLYLTTDGFVDQHNAERIKFGTTRLFALLEEISSQPISMQGQILKSRFKAHRNQMRQRDDVTILGVEI